ncbi:hypothetical protein ES708_32317 [subsurface metagenome]
MGVSQSIDRFSTESSSGLVLGRGELALFLFGNARFSTWKIGATHQFPLPALAYCGLLLLLGSLTFAGLTFVIEVLTIILLEHCSFSIAYHSDRGIR